MKPTIALMFCLSGVILPGSIAPLQGVGKWMMINSESIYGTTASPFGSLPWGRCTKKALGSEAVLYLHVFDWPANGELLNERGAPDVFVGRLGPLESSP